MQILPVLDLMGGLVVRGVAGRRSHYRPLVSTLCATAEPLAVAAALCEHFHVHELYVADLDAIAGQAPAVELYRELHAQGFRLWVDAGLGSAPDAAALAQAGVARFVAGLETLEGPNALAALCQQYGAERVVFSLDLKAGQPLAHDAWHTDDAGTIAAMAHAAGARSIIVLDLGRVGMNDGTGTEGLCRQLTRDFPDLDVIAGGGVRGADDLRRLEACGVRRALVASALHDGRLNALLAGRASDGPRILRWPWD